MEKDVSRRWTMGARGVADRGAVVPTNAGFIQDMGGRVTRYPLRRSEKTEQGGKHRDVQLGERWMDAMSVDYSCLFPTGMLNIGMHPQKEMESDLCWAYNRWVTEKVLPEGDGRMYSMLCLPFSDPAACVRQVETFGSLMHVTGFMVTTVRHLQANDNAYMRLYRMLEERGLALAFHSGPNWNEAVFRASNRFLSVQGKHHIMAATAARLFKLPPRNEKQKENLKRFGNLAAAA